uniref:Uncharacterized protein n=1 Tax=Ascaris lumbricoides TaxID=6252 RepID=A0A0M3IIE5_ASCLU
MVPTRSDFVAETRNWVIHGTASDASLSHCSMEPVFPTGRKGIRGVVSQQWGLCPQGFFLHASRFALLARSLIILERVFVSAKFVLFTPV